MGFKQKDRASSLTLREGYSCGANPRITTSKLRSAQMYSVYFNLWRVIALKTENLLTFQQL